MWQQGQEWTLFQWWLNSSILGKWVFLLLLVMFCQSTFVLLKRFWTLHRELHRASNLRDVLDRRTGAHTIADAITAITAMPPSLLSRLAVVGLSAYQAVPDRFTKIDAVDFAQRAMDRKAALIRTDMTIGRTTLATIAFLAPFVGLLGTMFAFLNSFRASSRGEFASLVASALLPTATGLAIGVLAIWFYNRVTGKMEVLIREGNDTMFRVFVFLQAHIEDGTRENNEAGRLSVTTCLSGADRNWEWEARFDRFRALLLSVGISSALAWFFLFLALVWGSIEHFTR